jgi:hypothetical protein
LHVNHERIWPWKRSLVVINVSLSLLFEGKSKWQLGNTLFVFLLSWTLLRPMFLFSFHWGQTLPRGNLWMLFGALYFIQQEESWNCWAFKVIWQGYSIVLLTLLEIQLLKKKNKYRNWTWGETEEVFSRWEKMYKCDFLYRSRNSKI